MQRGFFTIQNEVEAREDGQASLGGLWASYFRAFHSYQGEDGTKETQTHRGDHQTPAHLDIGFMTEAERESALNWWFHIFFALWPQKIAEIYMRYIYLFCLNS